MKETIAQKMDRLNDLVPASLPKEVDTHVYNLFRSYEYIIYDKKTAGEEFAYCTCCKKRVPKKYKLWQSIKHNSPAVCPVCKCSCTAKNKNIFGNYNKLSGWRAYYYGPEVRSLGHNINILIIQKLDDEYFVFRRFAVVKKTQIKNPLTTIEWAENQRIFFNGTKQINTIGYISGAGELYFSRSKRTNFYNNDSWNGYLFPEVHHCFTENLEELTKGTYLEYAIKIYHANFKKKWNILEFLANWKKPMEYLYKSGIKDYLYTSLEHGMNITGKEKSIAEVMKITPEYVSLVKKADLNAYEVGKLSKMIKLGAKNINENHIKQFCYVQPSFFALLKNNKQIEFSKVFDIVKSDFDATAQNYIVYEDYVSAALSIGKDINNPSTIYPKNIKQLVREHDLAVERQREMIRLKKEKKFACIEDRCKKENHLYSYSQNGLHIRMVKNYQELIKEGEALQHCVGGYADKVATGSTTICVIRLDSSPEDPFYTLEFSKWKVVQYYGFRNNRDKQKDSEVVSFVNAWEALVKKRLKARTRSKANTNPKPKAKTLEKLAV